MGKTIAYNTGSKDDDKKVDELRFTFGVFIDGTLNNKNNTQLRRYSRGESEHSTISDKKKKADLDREKSDLKKIEKGKQVDVPTGFKDLDEYKSYLEGVDRSFMDKQGTDNSYSNDDTNVARMWKCCDTKYAIYVEGMGTEDNTQDSQDGFMFGSGLTGIRARVRLACERVAKNIQAVKKGKKENRDKKVTEITFDVFGFSRGAASARNFVHEVNTKRAYDKKSIQIPDGYEPIDPHSRNDAPPRKKYRNARGDHDGMEIDFNGLLKNGQLPKFGHLGYSLLLNTDMTEEDLEELKIVVRFIGIYDTVSSYYEQDALGAYSDFGKLEDDSNLPKTLGFSSKDFANDEEELGLQELELNKIGDVTRFEKLVHFTAQDEHRKNFILTRIKQVPNKAIEKNLPGVHCDIGGAYENEEYEIIDEIGTTVKDSFYISKVFRWSRPKPQSFLGSVLSKIIETPIMGLPSLKQDLIDQYWYADGELKIKPDLGYFRLRGKRKVRKEYSYISLHFMEEYSKQTDMHKNITVPILSKYPLNNSFLEGIKTNLHYYVFGQDEEWEFVSDGQLEKEKYDRELAEKEQEEFDAQMKQLEEDLKSGKFERDQMVMKSDNLSPELYRPKVMEMNRDMPITEEVDETITEELDKPVNDDNPIQLKTVEVRGYDMQKELRILRHEYLHWSSTRDWFGMEPPNSSRKRESFPKV